MSSGGSQGVIDGSETLKPLRVRFTVKFESRFGQQVKLSGSCDELGQFDATKACDLGYEHPGIWTKDLELLLDGNEPLRFKYVVYDESMKEYTWEAGSERILEVDFGSLEGDLLLKDEFRTAPDQEQEIMSTAAFTDVVFRREVSSRLSSRMMQAQDSAAITKALILGKGGYVARFKVFCATVLSNHEVCVTGNTESLGNGDADRAVALSDTNFPWWSVCVPMSISDGNDSFSYRFLVREKSTLKVIAEEAERSFELNEADQKLIEASKARAVIVFAGCGERSVRFERRWRGAGVSVPVFSLRSAESCGVGEFEDLRKVVDFCAKTGFQLLQLLPVNDTTVYGNWRDSYPYSSVSCFALHPQYIRLSALGALPSALKTELENAQKELNALAEIDYEKVMDVKLSMIRKIYAIQKTEFLTSREFIEFFKKEQNWLVPYALFRMLSDLTGSPNFDGWGARSKITIEDLEKLAAPDSLHFDHLGVIYYTQFHLHKQLKSAADYAAKHSVVFKGDLPIGVNRFCADTWVNPHLFRLDAQAGAPPDYFAEYGQNWGFPTYEWDEMAKDGYAWWKMRLSHMAYYFHAYRIDHILGFFRIWEIPSDYVTGIAGRYRPAIAVKKSELDSRGLWDMDRYLSPYVHDGLLQKSFGSNWESIKNRFFEPTWGGRLKFKPEYDTEKKVSNALADPKHEKSLNNDAGKDIEFMRELKMQLLRLHGNVLLYQDTADSELFHPRFYIHKTASFQELSDEWKRQFSELYDDYFFKRQNELWRSQGMTKLPAMKAASNMLVCGEDLGFIPECVPDVMEATSIIGLRVQRMPETNEEFGNPQKYPWESVATLSSHDTSTFRAWYEDLEPDARARYYHDMLQMKGAAPIECTTEVAKRGVDHMLASPAMWAIFPMQDLLAMDEGLRRKNPKEEQINDPSNPDHYWRFRLHLDVADILKNKQFIELCSTMIKENHRGIPY